MRRNNAPGDRLRAWLVNALWCLWIATMLAIVAYAAINGDAALAELDRLNLLGAYASVP